MQIVGMSGRGLPSKEALGCCTYVCLCEEREKDWSPTEEEKEGLSFFGRRHKLLPC